MRAFVAAMFFTLVATGAVAQEMRTPQVCVAAIRCEIDVGFDTSDVESDLSGRHPKKSRSASHIQQSPTARATDLYDPPHPPAALLDTDSVVSNIVDISSGMAGTIVPEIILAAVERSNRRLGETRILEHQRAIHASVPAQAGGVKLQGVRRVYSFAAA